MNWHKPTAYAQRSMCECYSVAKVGTGKGHVYEAWRSRAHPHGPHLIAVNLPSAAAAKAVCEQDAAL
jgi:chromosomal replication initiation ATPase DnaA